MARCMREFLLVTSLAFAFSIQLVLGVNVTYDSSAIIIDGERRVIFSGSIHYPRSTVEMWPDLINKAKEGGLDAIETYVFWDRHEPQHRQYDFSGNLDFVKFFKTVQEAGLYAILRIGPYVCAEWNYGGFPMWLHNLSGVQLRTDNQVYKDEMQSFTTKIVELCKQANLFAPQGGPIILAQIENEYGNVMQPYGDAGKSYIKWCAQMATSQNIGIPWIMCQQSDAPEPMINTCNGFYCDTFKPNNPKNPKMWTENWTGWYKGWGERQPYRAAEDVAFSVARFIQFGGVLTNYYMYHGGTNFGRTSGGPYIATSYDYDAPLDEYGNLNQPKYGHLKQLHDTIKSVEKILTTSSSTTKQIGNGVDMTMYMNNATGEKVCFLGNINTTEDATVDLQQDGKFTVPAWSVSILIGCKNETYNTAKVSAQTSLMIKKSDIADNSDAKLLWHWKMEPIVDTLGGKGKFSAQKLLEQKEATVDASDYLWYMTKVHVKDKSIWDNATLRVNTSGHVLHAYVNTKLIGSQWGRNGTYNFTFQANASLRCGINYITLLSATVGQKNYDAFFDTVPNGIATGPVQFIGQRNATMDLTSNEWSYKVGLNGEHMKFYEKTISVWNPIGVPVARPMTWYKTTFKAPSGSQPVVVDLQGMGKGHAWVNGLSIGRYWPSFLAPNEGCADSCDYRGTYDPKNCVLNCGNPTQRWYHIPRSFLKDNSNKLVLFEEIGGNPANVSFQVVTVGTICGNAYKGSKLELSCQGGQISNISFASFGNPQGTCGSFQKGSCESANTLSVLQKACVGKETCTVDVSETTFGSTNCGNNTVTKLAVQVAC